MILMEVDDEKMAERVRKQADSDGIETATRCDWSSGKAKESLERNFEELTGLKRAIMVMGFAKWGGARDNRSTDG
jgi:hypothetical protein